MQVQKKSVLICDADHKHARLTASQTEFLGFDAIVAHDELSFRQELRNSTQYSALLVSADEEYRQLASVVHALGEGSVKSKIYLVRDDSALAAPPAGLASHVDGVLPAAASYKELQAVLEGTAIDSKSHIMANPAPDPRDTYSNSLLKRLLVGDSDEMLAVHRLIEQVAGTEASVLVTGESGTGKEVVARCVHSLSARSSGPFVPVNCGAIPAELLESELFGHEKGAFTGAINARQGRFEIAQGGTLFLDEIGDMPLDMQVKLLRVLQERTFERVGSHKTLRSDVRIIAATHRNLEQLVAEGKFREDLFYRLNVFPIEIMPLRKHASDIAALVECYIKKLRAEQGVELQLNDNAKACLTRYYWPGNVRELHNLLERLAILFPGQSVQWSDLPEKYRPNLELFDEEKGMPDPQSANEEQASSVVKVADLPSEGIDLRPHLAGIERSLMTQALAQSEWVVARAAKLLNLQRTTLVEKMRKFEIQRPDELPEF
ncbi:MAG: sigma-54 interaction domain-containing protein [Halioglobus sp.]